MYLKFLNVFLSSIKLKKT